MTPCSAHPQNNLPHAPIPDRLLQANAAYGRALVDAILQDLADMLLQAFLLNLLVPSYDVAKTPVAEIWGITGTLPEGDTS